MKYEELWKNKQLSKMFYRPHSTMTRILERNEKIRETCSYLCTVQGNTKKKKYNGVEDDPFQRALYYWLCREWSSGVLVSGILLQEKAKMFYEKIHGPSNFSTSSGWLYNFKRDTIFVISRSKVGNCRRIQKYSHLYYSFDVNY